MIFDKEFENFASSRSFARVRASFSSCSDTAERHGKLKRKKAKEEIIRKSEKEREKKERALERFEYPFVSSTFSSIINKASGRRVFFLGMLVDQAAGTLISYNRGEFHNL